MKFDPEYEGRPTELSLSSLHLLSIRAMLGELLPGFEFALGQRGEVYLSADDGPARRWFPDGHSQTFVCQPDKRRAPRPMFGLVEE